MSFTDRLVLWLHIGVAIFTIGPATAAIMSTPRYIRKHDAVVVGFLHRITKVYSVASLLVLVFGIVLADLRDDFSKPWVSISMTLFVVALVLLVLIMRDQRAAVAALRTQAAVPAKEPDKTAVEASAESAPDSPVSGTAATASGAEAAPPADSGPARVRRHPELAAVQRGRIASLGGVTALIWLVILILMVWR